jgi:poly-gamma-glutamate synthesis protein (capsule biosynthesis protein)
MSALLPAGGAPADFIGTSSEIDDATFARMRDCSWRDVPACPPRSALRYLRIAHHTFESGHDANAGSRWAVGELVVAAAIAHPTLTLFARLWQVGLPIAQMRLVDDFAGSDDASMAANNCSAFNFRTVAGTSALSLHALGLAIDINPIQNPWLVPGAGATPERLLPAAGDAFRDRKVAALGMFVRPGPVVATFDELGWEWGGDWRHAFDYHHIVWRGRALS